VRRATGRGWRAVLLAVVAGSVGTVVGWSAVAQAASTTTSTAAAHANAPSSTKAKHYPVQVALFGDSLAWEAQPYWMSLIHEDKESGVSFDTFGGTATCDFLKRMQEVETKDHPKAVELLFSGNNLTACMKGDALYSDAYYKAYRAYTLNAIDIFAAGHAHVYLIGAPITKKQLSVPGWQRLDLLYATLAKANPSVTYVDAGAAVEGPGGSYTDILPCQSGQPCTGPIVNGTPSDVVRSSDGTHFCPVHEGDVKGVIEGCPVYSSGAYRLASAMVAPLAVKAK
jgi:hypothetical protein